MKCKKKTNLNILSRNTHWEQFHLKIYTKIYRNLRMATILSFTITEGLNRDLRDLEQSQVECDGILILLCWYLLRGICSSKTILGSLCDVFFCRRILWYFLCVTYALHYTILKVEVVGICKTSISLKKITLN